MIAEDGRGTVVSFALIAAVAGFINLLYPFIVLDIVFYAALFLFLFSLYFFRDPKRKIQDRPGWLISPADGTIIQVKPAPTMDGLDGDYTLVSIFLALTNVHVNRIPLPGKVTSVVYKKGQFLAAFNPEATNLNEQYEFDIASRFGLVRVKQIAGIIARRLVCNLKSGDEVSVGEKFGLMKFSSRIDLFIPANAEIKVTDKEKVRGGETVIAIFAEGSYEN